MPLKIFIVDDHSTITASYKHCIESMEDLVPYEIDCFNSIEKLCDALAHGHVPDMLFLDLSMPSFAKEQIEDGFHLSKIMRNKFTAVKIIISTMHTSPFYIYNVIERVKPEAFLLKSDVDATEICKSIETVLSGKKYYSKTAQNVIDTVSGHSFCQDEMNRNILLLTSERYTNKEISEKLFTSASTVEKRKAAIKSILNIEGQNDKKLIEILKNLNLL